MPGMQGSKLKLLYLMEILWLYTDEEHILSANEICQKLEEYGSQAERKSVYTDIEALRTFGFNIVNARSPKRGYFLATRLLDPAEIRILMDAVREAAFIPLQKKTSLLKKVGSLTSEKQAEFIEKQMFINDDMVIDEKKLCYKINVLHAAVRDKKQVEFVMVSRHLHARYSSKLWEESLRVDPYALICEKGKYVLLCSDPNSDEVLHVFLDRMEDLKLLSSDASEVPQEFAEGAFFDVRKYCCKARVPSVARTMIAQLSCSEAILEDVLDRFGMDVMMKSLSDNTIRVRARVELSADLVAWIMSYGTDIRVDAPESLAEAVSQKAHAIAGLYQ